MPAKLAEIAARRLALLGYGREGRAFADAMAARHPGARLTVLTESEPDVPPADWPLEVGPFELSPGRFDVLIRSPGVRVEHPALCAFRQAGGTVINPTSIWFAERPGTRVAVVTGSKGKSTTAALISHLARACGIQTVLAGNIGVPLMAYLDSPAELFVVEMSSFQLADLEGSPQLGLMTRLFPEHLDWHGDVQAYYGAKLRLLELLAGAPLVVNAIDPVLLESTDAYAGRVLANRPPGIHARPGGLFRDDECILAHARFPLPGRHNLDNLSVAVSAGILIGLDLERMLAAARDFPPLAHRLEALETRDHRRWINDSVATSPYATRAALESLAGSPITLIAGGMERGGDWRPVIEWCHGAPLGALVTLPDNGPRIAAELATAGSVRRDRVFSADILDQAVAAARRCTPPGGVVLLSPGAPSFPHFRDFEERGERFRKLVLGARG